ncbi:YwmB family TATA-box binding protein [Fictibacillus terranigra]|uniref:YwmB family TATA-box binding protein n=1 Tax=Fictibacillus terranigra TaxID=3058424 RepID=A0ABT8E137_9BACL|nr:YwmB family TATA-box binding protein [Fictibacillus sp. CENA-BCM004]MDN4071616.1 YwmB family TATA-box binding protein [Fictibacillus sp. CENA-BCM004]
MKKNIVLFFAIIFLVHSYASVQAKETANVTKILDMKQAMDQHGVILKKWSVYTKGSAGFTLDVNGYRQKAALLKKAAKGYKWNAINEQEHLKMSGVRFSEAGSIKERLTLVAYPQKGKLATYLVYAVEGRSWNKNQFQQFARSFQSRVATYFEGKTATFSCVTGVHSDTMDVGLYKQALELMTTFSAVPVEELKEETFVSISAYTKHWDEKLNTAHKAMNLQIAIRNQGMGGQTAVTIGTPIITSEY